MTANHVMAALNRYLRADRDLEAREALLSVCNDALLHAFDHGPDFARRILDAVAYAHEHVADE